MKQPDVYVVTGEIHSGKTTRLQIWASATESCYGVLTPKVNGQRVFLNPASGEQWPMEAGEEDKDPLLVGKYRFSKSCFLKASKVLEEGIEQMGKRWIVLDEIGPLECKGEGFAAQLRQALEKAKQDPELSLVLVVRSSLVKTVQETFCIGNLHYFLPGNS